MRRCVLIRTIYFRAKCAPRRPFRQSFFAASESGSPRLPRLTAAASFPSLFTASSSSPRTMVLVPESESQAIRGAPKPILDLSVAPLSNVLKKRFFTASALGTIVLAPLDITHSSALPAAAGPRAPSRENRAHVSGHTAASRSGSWLYGLIGAPPGPGVPNVCSALSALCCKRTQLASSSQSEGRGPLAFAAHRSETKFWSPMASCNE